MRASVLKSIFNRKGNESTFAKVIENENSEFSAFAIPFENEEAVLLFNGDNCNFILTNQRLILREKDDYMSYEHSTLDQVSPLDIEEKKTSFSNIILSYNNGIKLKLKLNKGESYNGILQIFFFLLRQN